MRIRILLAVGALCLGLSLSAEAVPADPGGTVGLVIQQRAPGSLSWDLYLFSAPGAEVLAFDLITTGFTGFAYDTSVPNLSLEDSFFMVDVIGGIDLLRVAGFPSLGGVDDLDGLLLGTYTSEFASIDSVAISNDLAGFPSVVLVDGIDQLPTDQVAAIIVPEMGASLAALLPLLTLGWLRRSGMRNALSLAVAASCVGFSSGAAAVPTDPGGTVGIVIEQRAPGSLSWDLYLFSAPGAEVGAIMLLVGGFSDFAFDLDIPNASYADSLWLEDPLGDGSGRSLVFLPAFLPGALGGTDDLNGLLLGTLTSTLPDLESVSIGVGQDSVGPAAYDRVGNPYAVEDVVMRVVPEANAPLAWLAFAALALLRRSRAAQHLAG